jgi:hypothetical protein
MFGFLKKLFSTPCADRVPLIHDPVLGELRQAADGDWWESTLAIGGRSVQFQIGGDREPDAALVAHAREIAGDFSAFIRKVDDFLSVACGESPDAADEIRQLTLGSVCLFWPQRPRDGMLFFQGPDEFRVWRCDYIQGQPRDLGCDT